jgi:hypothetical protein
MEVVFILLTGRHLRRSAPLQIALQRFPGLFQVQYIGMQTQRQFLPSAAVRTITPKIFQA